MLGSKVYIHTFLKKSLQNWNFVLKKVYLAAIVSLNGVTKLCIQIQIKYVSINLYMKRLYPLAPNYNAKVKAHQ